MFRKTCSQNTGTLVPSKQLNIVKPCRFAPMVAVFSLRLDSNINEKSREHLLKKASDETRSKANSFYHKEDAYRSLFAEFLARYLFMQRTGLSNSELVFRYSPY